MPLTGVPFSISRTIMTCGMIAIGFKKMTAKNRSKSKNNVKIIHLLCVRHRSEYIPSLEMIHFVCVSNEEIESKTKKLRMEQASEREREREKIDKTFATTHALRIFIDTKYNEYVVCA